MKFYSMRQQTPDLGPVENYSDHGEHCVIQKSEPVMIIRSNFSPIIARFACYTWTEDDGFVEPSYCYEMSDNPMDIVNVFYDDAWIYLDEMEEFVLKNCAPKHEKQNENKHSPAYIPRERDFSEPQESEIDEDMENDWR